MADAALASLADELRGLMSGAVELDLPLAGHTHYAAGGPADLALFPEDAAGAAAALALLRRRGCPVTVLGGGTSPLRTLRRTSWTVSPVTGGRRVSTS